MIQYDYLIVGSGLYGAAFAYNAKLHGKRCLVIDKRSHIGGNIYCENVDGINVHKYGPHIFHTSNKNVWNFVNSIIDFDPFIYTPVANYQGNLYNLPFNMNTFYTLWGVKTPMEAEHIINEQRKESEIKTPKNLEEQAISLVGRDIYEKLIKGYTEKQWGRRCSELPSFIIKRIPVRFTFNNNYFNDTYQGIPTGGYNCLISSLLDGIDVKTNTDYLLNREHFDKIAHRIVYTGAIDEYYNYCLGKLEYRTVKFESEILPCKNFQGSPVVNYTGKEVPFTRVIEHKHFKRNCELPFTVVTKEYSQEWINGAEPFYPINNDRNNNLYSQYKSLTQNDTNVIFGGRLAEYKYYDMWQIIDNVLQLCTKEFIK
jgi:UDP-galactopyranose mutase